jgi:hypothetical protein
MRGQSMAQRRLKRHWRSLGRTSGLAERRAAESPAERFRPTGKDFGEEEARSAGASQFEAITQLDQQLLVVAQVEAVAQQAAGIF